MATNFDSLTAAQLAAGVASGAWSAVEVARAALDAIQARERFSWGTDRHHFVFNSLVER